MYDLFYNILQPSLKDLQLHYKDTDSFVLSFSEGNVNNEHMDVSNLEPRSGFPYPSIKSNNKFPSKFKHEFGNKWIEEFMALSTKTYSFKDYPNKTKEKGVKNCYNAKPEEYYNVLMYKTQRTVDKCRGQKVGGNMTTTKTSKTSLNTFDDKRFYANNIKSYPHDENLYLFKRNLVNEINKGDTMLCHTSLGLHKDQLTNNILEITITYDRKLIEAAIRLYNDLCILKYL